MVVFAFPVSRVSGNRLTTVDRNDLFGRWPQGRFMEVETKYGEQLEYFIAIGEIGEPKFVIWRATEGGYYRQDTRTGRVEKGETLQRVMPDKV